MRDLLFPRWCGALAFLLPLSDVLFLPATVGAALAALLSSGLTALLGAALSRIPMRIRRSKPMRRLAVFIALLLLWPALWPMTDFLAQTALPHCSRVVLALFLLLCVGLLAHGGLVKLGMWAWPTALLPAMVCLLSVGLTLQNPPAATAALHSRDFFAVWPLLCTGQIPVALFYALCLPPTRRTAFAGGLLLGGGLAALLCLRSAILLGAFTAAQLPYPNYAAAGLAVLGDFARRGESLFAAVLLPAVLARAALPLTVLRLPLRRFFGIIKAPKERTTHEHSDFRQK